MLMPPQARATISASARQDIRRRAAWSLFVLAALLAVPASPAIGPAQAESSLAGRASVRDGDTLEIHGKKIRLHGIDAPEAGQTCQRADGTAWRCGRDAAFALADHIGSRPVRCETRDMDRYGRFVARCEQNGEDIGAWMVRSGWAVAYRQYSQDYAPEEREARAARRGLWRGHFELPWDWRQRNRN